MYKIPTDEKFYFFECVDKLDYKHYFVAHSIEELFFRFGSKFMRSFVCITRLNRVTQEHLDAIDTFLKQQS